MPLNCNSLFILFQFAVLNLSNSGSPLTENEYIFMSANSHGVSPKKPRKRPHKTKKRLAIKQAAQEARAKK